MRISSDNDLLSGSIVVEQVFRPPRVAVLVGTQQHCSDFIKLASFYWGGFSFLPIPFPGKHLSNKWLEVVGKFKPDFVFSFHLLSEQEKITLKAKLHIDVVDKTEKNHEIGFGIPVLNILALDGFLEHKDKFPTLRMPRLGRYSFHPIYLHAHYGIVDMASYWRELANYGVEDWRKNLDDLFPINWIDVPHNLAAHLVEQNSVLRRDRSISIIEYTAANLGYRYALYEENKSLLVVSSKKWLDDFCLFWMLRRQSFSLTDPPVLWLPASELASHQGSLEKYSRATSISLTSQKLTTELAEAGLSRIEVINHPLKDWLNSDFLPGDFHETPVFFEQNQSRIPIPASEILSAIRYERHCFLDLSIPTVKLPDVKVGFWETEDWRNVKQKNYSINGKYLSFTMRGGSNRLINLSLPTRFELLATIGSEADYRVHISDKGLIAQRVLDLLGGLHNIWILSSPGILKLFQEMSELYQAKEFKTRLRKFGVHQGNVAKIMASISGDHHERIYKTADGIREVSELPQNMNVQLIKWLVSRNILFRGADIKCTNCNTAHWISIDEFKAVVKCVGCFEEIPIPVRPDTLTWKYRINTLLAKAFDQGVIPHLLTAVCVLDQNSTDLPPNSLLGEFYGVNFVGKDANRSVIKEADIFLIINGKTIIGECKTNGYELSPTEVNRNLQLAKELGCSEVIFSVLDDGTSVKDSIRNAIKASSVPSRLVTSNELMQRYWGRAIGESMPPQGNLTVNVEGTFNLSLENFLAKAD